MPTEYPKKYWWVILVVVPLIAALISIIPQLIKCPEKPSGAIYISNTKFSEDLYFADIEVILNQYKDSKGELLKEKELKQKILQALILVKEGNYQDAIDLFRDVSEQSDLPAVYNNLGVLYAVTEEYDSAREAYSKAIEKDPEYQTVYLNLGLLDEREGKIDQAIQHLKRAPDLEKAHKVSKRIEEQKNRSEPVGESGIAIGILEFKWPGGDCWDIYRMDKFVAYHCGTDKQALQADTYTIKPRSDLVFKPFSVNIQKGHRTTVP